MLPFIITGVAAVGMFSAMLISDFKKYENERKNINEAQNISKQNNTINKIVNLDSAVSGTEINQTLSNSKLLVNKPITYKIVNFDNGEKEKGIVNKYSESVKKVLATNPNLEVNCSILSGTNLITYEECLLVHDKSYNFYHKEINGNLSYRVENEKVNKYVAEIEAHRYNLKTEEVVSEDKIILDKNYIASPSKFINKKNTVEKENSIIKVKNYLKDSNYVLASAELFNIKKNNYQYTPIISSLYIQLFDEVEFQTKNAQIGSEKYELRLKIQAEFAKLTRVSNIVENLEVKEHPLAENFIKNISTSYGEIQNYENTQNFASTNLPTLNNFNQTLSTLSTNVTQIK